MTGGTIRTDKNGNELPSARKVRTELHTTGRIVDKYMFNAAVYHMLEFIHVDISSVNSPRKIFSLFNMNSNIYIIINVGKFVKFW